MTDSARQRERRRRSASRRLARSHLFAPGHREDLLVKVCSAGADAVVLDLEDAVSPAEKRAARGAVARLLEALPSEASDVWVRINGAQGDHWRDDVAAVVGPALAGIRLPKAESADAVRRLDEELSRAEDRAGRPPGEVRLMLTVESALGVSRLPQLAGCCERLEGFSLGAADLIADLGAQPEAQGLATLYSASRLVVESAAAGLAAPVAPVWTRLEDDEGLKRSTRWHRNLGFFGRSAIHPRQLETIHRVFTPDAEEIERARRIVEAHESARADRSMAVTTEDGEFIDEAILRQARAVLDLARRGGEDD
jgi:citrate lyase subunit beta/citryl-CoA lyase